MIASRAAALLLAAPFLAACVTERSRTLAMIPEGSLARSADDARALREPRPQPASLDAVPASFAAIDPASVVPPPRPEPAAALPPPPRNPDRPAAHKPLPPGVTVEEAAREKFLWAPTVVEAQKATFYCSAALAAEATLTGSVTTDDGPGRRTAAGHAVLTLRRLIVRAERVTLVVRSDGKRDVQLTARGGVSLRSEQAASVIEETGLKSLLLTNDGYTPLR